MGIYKTTFTQTLTHAEKKSAWILSGFDVVSTLCKAEANKMLHFMHNNTCSATYKRMRVRINYLCLFHAY